MYTLDQTLLFKKFKQSSSHEQIAQLEKLTKKAADKLSLVRDTFPTYTLHNEQHSLNIIVIMSDLLGDKIDQLTTLELYVLILSAYYHDIGMVFSNEERNQIQEEEDFNIFLKEKPKAILEIDEYRIKNNSKNEIPEEIAEWYCRWIHPDRSASLLTTSEKILWNSHPINEAIGLVCKSHGYSIDKVHNWPKMSTEYLGKADLLFCSILLRLADILDFDNSRSPDEVYKYLGIANHVAKRELESDVEWRKHLCSSGFLFTTQSRDERYVIKFASAPKEPAVEYDVRAFLKIIETEFEKCNTALKFCDKKWQNFRLPYAINTSGIESQGYTYGEFKFTLEQDQVLALLMGENLYSDQYAFMRELVQNAIDTTRHRIIYEANLGNLDFITPAINISSWLDKDGYTWFRIDDSGMGMDEDIITNFFLKIGKSYYQSEKFRAELLKWGKVKNISFMPISRFGIGILSCFMVGDKIEVSTRRRNNESPKNALRLSMNGINSFFTLKKENELHSSENMPNAINAKEIYKSPNSFGTSIAVRFHSKSEYFNHTILQLLNNYVVASPIEMLYNGHVVGKDFNTLIQTEWINPIRMPIDKEDQDRIEEILSLKFSGQLIFRIEPVNFTLNSPSPNLLGQGVVAFIDIPEKDLEYFTSKKVLRSIQLDLNYQYDDDGFSDKGLRLNISRYNKELEDSLKHEYKIDTSDWPNLFEAFKEAISILIKKFKEKWGNENKINLDYFFQSIASIKKSEEIYFDHFRSIGLIVADKNDLIDLTKALIDRVLIEGRYNVKELNLFIENINKQFDNVAPKLEYCLASINTDFSYTSEPWNNYVKSIPEFLIDNDWLKELEEIYEKANEYRTLLKAKNDVSGSDFIFLNGLDSYNDLLCKFEEREGLSHNGINIPERTSRYEGRRDVMFEISNPVKNGVFFYNIYFQDNLRPDLSLSRDEIKDISFEIYSTTTLALFRSIFYKNININLCNLYGFTNLNPYRSFKLGEILKDVLMHNENDWPSEKIFSDGTQHLSVVDIKNCFKKCSEYVLEWNFSTNNEDYMYENSFLQYCRNTLIQLNLDIKLDTSTSKINIISDNKPMVREEEMYFQPLFFIKYDKDDFLKIKSFPFNINFPFSTWLIKNTIDLAHHYPNLLAKIISLMERVNQIDDIKIKDFVDGINEALTTLVNLNYENKPKSEIFLKIEDLS